MQKALEQRPRLAAKTLLRRSPHRRSCKVEDLGQAAAKERLSRTAKAAAKPRACLSRAAKERLSRLRRSGCHCRGLPRRLLRRLRVALPLRVVFQRQSLQSRRCCSTGALRLRWPPADQLTHPVLLSPICLQVLRSDEHRGEDKACGAHFECFVTASPNGHVTCTLCSQSICQRPSQRAAGQGIILANERLRSISRRRREFGQ